MCAYDGVTVRVSVRLLSYGCVRVCLCQCASVCGCVFTNLCVRLFVDARVDVCVRVRACASVYGPHLCVCACVDLCVYFSP